MVSWYHILPMSIWKESNHTNNDLLLLLLLLLLSFSLLVTIRVKPPY